jgi:predicted AAA+ superfamily ATPase
MYKRQIYKAILKRLHEPRRFIQVLSGPRQTGKTTLARQIMEAFSGYAHYATADEPALKVSSWVEQQWEVCRTKIRTDKHIKRCLLVLDEIQKTSGWSETVKRLWDEDSARGLPVLVVILGSSPLLMQKGLTESLAGRFEIIPIAHWSYAEMRDAFHWDVDHYVYYGGYPGAASLIDDNQRWRSYVQDSLIETSISRDILQMTRVDKPALLRRLFEAGCAYSGQILSYQKMLGQLQDAGNTVTLAHYLQLLQEAGLLAGLSKYAGQHVRQRASSPKLLVLNTALMTASAHLSLDTARQDTDFWGRLVESAAGASLASAIKGKDIRLFYWAGRNREVDFVLARGDALVAIEVKSSRRKTSLPGIDAFSREFPVKRKLLVGSQGIPLDEFFLVPPETWFA